MRDGATDFAIQAGLRRRSLIRFAQSLFPWYMAGWWHRLVAASLEAFSRDVVSRSSPRLLIKAPPRHGKSLLASESFPTWHLGSNPDHEIIVGSYSADSAKRRSRASRRMAEHELMLETFPRFCVDRTARAVQEWHTTAGGRYQAVGVGGGVTGGGANVVIIDDPVKGWDRAMSQGERDKTWAWYGTDIYTRLSPGGGVLVIQTPWHEDDLQGRLVREMKRGGDVFRVISFPAIAEKDEDYRLKGEALHPERWSVAELERRIRQAGPYGGPALYQLRPTTIGGNLWLESWFRFWTKAPEKFERIVLSVDCSFKGLDTSDFVAIQVWGETIEADGERHYWLLHQVHDRMGIVRTLKEIEGCVQLAQDVWGNVDAVLVEDKANGSAVIELLRGKVAGRLVPIEPRGGKVARMVAASPVLAAGRVHVPHAVVAPWIVDFLEEVTKVPAAPNDDQADATSQVILWLEGDGQDEGELLIF